MRASVDLPEPFAPTMPTRRSPSSSVTSSTTRSSVEVVAHGLEPDGAHATRSTIIAMPWPPPIEHAVRRGTGVAGGVREHPRRQPHEQDGAGRAPRMAQRDRAAVARDGLLVEPEVVAHGEQLRGERLGDLDEAEVADRHAGAGERGAEPPARRAGERRRVAAGDRGGRRERRQAEPRATPPS